MKTNLSLFAVLLFAVVGVAHAHAHLEHSQPAANSIVSIAPKNVVLTFNEAVQLTALTLQRGDDKPQDLGPLPKAVTKEITVPMPTLMPGNYIIKWRAVSDDNHVASGKVVFTIK
jgi:methionine-rich copper-binding protein CopC